MQIKKCCEEIKNELALIDELFLSHALLLKKVKRVEPDQIEISAVATVLHSFYNGIENIFKRIATRIDNDFPRSEYWHQELLEQMTTENKNRKPVISNELSEKLNLYLGFRHFFRYSYSFQFKWHKMKELTLELSEVYDDFRKVIETFIEDLKE